MARGIGPEIRPNIDARRPGQAALVVGASVTNAAVAGRGVIDGSAPMFVTGLDSVTDQFNFGTDDRAYPGIDRVRLVLGC